MDYYVQLKESCFVDYGIKMHDGNVTIIQDYEENILKMRVSMRKINYLTKPDKDNDMLSMENEELNPNLRNLVQVAQEQRQENIMNLIRHNDINAGYKTNAQFQVLKNASEESLHQIYKS